MINEELFPAFALFGVSLLALASYGTPFQTKREVAVKFQRRKALVGPGRAAVLPLAAGAQNTKAQANANQRPIRIAVMHFAHETVTFLPYDTTTDDFIYEGSPARGEALLGRSPLGTSAVL